MGEPVIERGEPLNGAMAIEVVDDMDFASEGGEELAGRDIPIAMKPGATLPT
jgi:hypothetical protein